jgi:long-chain fatty acid transport protein
MELQVAPHIFYGKPFNERVTFGFGLNSPFGLGTDWGRNTNFSPVVTEARLAYISGTSAVAYKVNDQLSLGASVSINHADLSLEQGLGVAGSFLRFEGSDLAMSGALSARWQPAEKHAFGLIYSSGSKFELDGKTVSSALPSDNSATFDFMSPARIAGGYSYRPAPGWNVEANIEWLNWDSLDTLTLKSSSIGGSLPVTFDWESSFIYELGVSYTYSSGYVFSAGYDYNENSQPDRNFTPGVSDADRHWFNVGVGKRMETSSWMLAYQFGYSNRVVDGATNPLANGKYKSRHNALVLSWQRSF